VKQFNGICIITQDVQKLRNFYRDVLQTDPEGDDVFATFSTAAATLSLFTEQGMEQMAPNSMKGAGHGGYTLEFEVEDVDREYQRLTQLNIPIVKSPTTQSWGRRSVWFRDPDGNIVNFYAVLDGGKRAAAKDVVRDYFHRLLNEKDLSVCDERLSSDYRDHDAPLDTPLGPENTKEFVARFLDEYPNLRVDIEDLIAEENRVAARIVWHGNQRETGAEFHQIGIVLLRLDEKGRIAERWSAYKSFR
jgi:catechol 2,3-dioxygenase-like lactoylglutathione lyase family enzyme/predicted SnoaL-like aldol condensation-catalyzing enzyme